MLHGPCRDWCIVNEKCSKNFPKTFRNKTTIDENEYPFYRRRVEGITFTRNDYIFYNFHVVPYNASLLETFNYHINVEIVSSITANNYLYKYVLKGHYKAEIMRNGNISNVPAAPVNAEYEKSHGSSVNAINHDEVRSFVDARYLSPVEAVWRILSKS